MTPAEALLIADRIGTHDGKGALTACLTLAAEVRRLTAELDEARTALPQAVRNERARWMPEAADSLRYQWLREWLRRQCLLTALFCRPSAEAPTGNYWVLHEVAMVSGGSCEGYGKTEEEAIDAAMAKETA